MAELEIGEVARRAGIAASAIRYYENEGLIDRPARRSGRRVYGAEIIDRLALIELAKGGGFTIAEIKRLLAGFASRTPPGQRWRTLAEGKLRELDDRISEAQSMRSVLQTIMRCECLTIEDCSRMMTRDQAGQRPESSGRLDLKRS